MVHLIGEFETTALEKHECDSYHHEQRKHSQLAFAQNVKSLTETLEDVGNPFTEDSSDLLVLDSRNIMDVAVANTVQQIEQIEYECYVEERLVKQTTSIMDPIKCNNLHLFCRSSSKFPA